MKQKLFSVSTLLALTLILAACGPGAAQAADVPQPAPATDTPQPTPTEVPTEVVVPAVEVMDQGIEEGSVKVPSVSMAVDGWVVIHTTNTEGKPGPVIGYAPVPAGSSTNVEVGIETDQVTPQLFAMLHVDAGVAGTYEFPGDDVPVKNGDAIVMKPFNLTGLESSISVSDQEIKDGSVTIDSAFMLQPGWVVIHTTSAEGKPGPVIGHAALPAGPSQEVPVSIEADQATPQLFAMLHVDAGTAGTYEFPGDDVPVTNGDAVVMVPFNAVEAPPSAEVNISNFSFGPNELEVKVGTTVTWTNKDGTNHTVTSDDGAFDSGTLRRGSSFSFTFTEAGTFTYHCNFHSGMTGGITVIP